jgi:L-galactose dehydrogenase/L-glyceraldehyde 3-phosphate reductase
MQRRRFGRAGLEVPALTFGGGWVGGLLIRGTEAEREGVLNRALGAGIDWIDTAALYGNGASEATIGRHIHSLDPQPQVSTKVRLERDEMSDIPGAIERSLEQSLKRLNLERVALFQLHNQLGEAVGDRPTLTVQQVLGAGGVADTFDRLREQGLFHATGLTAAGDTGAILGVIDSGRFDCAQVYYNVLNPSAGWLRSHQNWRAQDFSGILAACFHQDMGVLNIRVFAGGPLANPGRPERLSVLISGTDVDNEVRSADAVRATLGDDYGSSAQIALRFALGNHDVATRVIGVGAMRDLDEAVEAVAAGPLPPEAIKKLELLWATDFRA